MKVKISALMELLFKNNQLDNIRILSILGCFPRNKNGIFIEELIYYYTLLLSEYNDILNEKNRYNTSNLYINFQNRIKNNILILNSQNHIQIFGEITNNLNEIKVKITPEGKEYINELSNNYFVDLKDKLEKIKKEHKYSNKAKRKVLNGGSYE